MKERETVPDTYTLVYDGACNICRRSIHWVKRWDREGRIEILAYQEPEVARRYPEVSEEQFQEAMQLFAPDGARWEGAGAVEALLELIPGAGWAAPFFRIPGVRRVADLVYRVVARNRRRLGCGEHCRIPDRDQGKPAGGSRSPGDG